MGDLSPAYRKSQGKFGRIKTLSGMSGLDPRKDMELLTPLSNQAFD